MAKRLDMPESSLEDSKPESALKQLRDRLGLTQEELSRRCGIPLRTYVRWETGEATPRPTIPQVKALCRELGVAIDKLPDNFGPPS